MADKLWNERKTQQRYSLGSASVKDAAGDDVPPSAFAPAGQANDHRFEDRDHNASAVILLEDNRIKTAPAAQPLIYAHGVLPGLSRATPEDIADGIPQAPVPDPDVLATR